MTRGEPTDERPSEDLASIVFDLFGVSISGSSDAWQGEESIGWRGSSPDGDRFVQRFPAWRTLDELTWCDAVALAASTHAPACVHAVASRDGATAVATPEGPVMVFPFVEGAHPGDEPVVPGAAEVLAAIHRGIVHAWDPATGARSGPGWAAGVGAALLVDDELDRWERAVSTLEAELPIHGDYYGGNLIVEDGCIVGVIDWSEARLASQEQEVAWAVWEFCQNEVGEELDDERAESFLQAYLGAGGPAPVARPFDPCPWIRLRLRAESRAWFTDPRSVTETSDYHEAQLVAFERLRTHRLPGR